jgi:hypothetical protein
LKRSKTKLFAGPGRKRGVPVADYHAYRRMVIRKETTWAALEKARLVLAPHREAFRNAVRKALKKKAK